MRTNAERKAPDRLRSRLSGLSATRQVQEAALLGKQQRTEVKLRYEFAPADEPRAVRRGDERHRHPRLGNKVARLLTGFDEEEWMRLPSLRVHGAATPSSWMAMAAG